MPLSRLSGVVMAEVLLGLGANVGDPAENLRRAIEALSSECQIVRVSSAYRTEPVGYDDQDWYLNVAVVVSTQLEPNALLTLIARIEASLGRERGIPNGPRTIDIDILLWGEMVRADDPTVPHPRMHLRKFVLEPAVEIAGDWVHPIQRQPLQNLLNQLDAGEAVDKVSLRNWPPSIAP